MANMVNNLDTNEDITFDKLSLKDYTDNLNAFLESSENEISDKIIEFVEKWIELQEHKKILSKKESDLKALYTKYGVPVARVSAVMDKMKKKIVQKPSEKQEEEEEWSKKVRKVSLIIIETEQRHAIHQTSKQRVDLKI